MGHRATYVIVSEQRREFFYSHWGGLQIACVMLLGPERCLDYIRTLDRSQELLDNIWCEGGILLDTVKRTAAFFGDDMPNSCRRLRALCDALANTWPEWEVHHAPTDVLGFAADLGVPEEKVIRTDKVLVTMTQEEFWAQESSVAEEKDCETLLTWMHNDEVVDVAIRSNVFDALSVGPAIIGRLRSLQSTALPVESTLSGGAYINSSTKEVHYWSEWNSSEKFVGVRDLWADWKVVTHSYGLPQHLALSERSSSSDDRSGELEQREVVARIRQQAEHNPLDALLSLSPDVEVVESSPQVHAHVSPPREDGESYGGRHDSYYKDVYEQPTWVPHWASGPLSAPQAHTRALRLLERANESPRRQDLTLHALRLLRSISEGDLDGSSANDVLMLQAECHHRLAMMGLEVVENSRRAMALVGQLLKDDDLATETRQRALTLQGMASDDLEGSLGVATSREAGRQREDRSMGDEDRSFGPHLQRIRTAMEAKEPRRELLRVYRELTREHRKARAGTERYCHLALLRALCLRALSEHQSRPARSLKKALTLYDFAYDNLVSGTQYHITTALSWASVALDLRAESVGDAPDESEIRRRASYCAFQLLDAGEILRSIEAFDLLARAEAACGNSAAELTALHLEMTCVEEVYAGLRALEDANRWLWRYAGLYRSVSVAHLHLNQTVEAVAAMERYRCRSLSRAIELRLETAGESIESRREYRQLLPRVERLSLKQMDTCGEVVHARERDELLERLVQLESELRDHPVALAFEETHGTQDQIQRVTRELGPIVYLIVQESEVEAVVCTERRMIVMDLTDYDLVDATRAWLAIYVAWRSGVAKLNQASRSLRQLLQACDSATTAIREQLGWSEGERFCVIGGGALARVPWHLTRAGTGGAWSSQPVCFSPSLALLARSLGDGEPAPTHIVIVCPESAPRHAKLEAARLIRNLVEKYGREAVVELTKDNASKDNILEHIQRATAFHFAGHATWDHRQTLRSGLLVSKGETLSVSSLLESYAPSLHLVTLAGCETALADDLPGHAEDYLGLSGIFLLMGARTVVSSLWALHDSSARDLVAEVYGRLVDGCDVGTALVRAQREVMGRTDISSDEQDPLFWGSLQLVGDSRTLLGSQA